MVSEHGQRRLLDRLAREQRAERLPSVVAGIATGGAPVWCGGSGAMVGDPAVTQYRIGSITKTFVAVSVMRLRDEGRLRLSDRVVDHLPDAPTGEATIAQVLSHASGLRAETDAPWWERTAGGAWTDLLPRVATGARPHAPGRRFHYSNVGFAVLGQLIACFRGAPWSDVVTQEILRPLEMERTTALPEAPHAEGAAVHPWADVALPEPAHDAGAMGPAGQLWSTVADLARWAAFLCGDSGDVLAADTVEEMRHPLAFDDRPGQPWTVAFGLGVQIWNVDGRRFVGHGGSMPGFVASLRADPATNVGVIAMSNSTGGFSGDLVGNLGAIADEEIATEAPWTPAEVAPDVLEICGVWHWGPTPFSLTARSSDSLELRPIGEGRGSGFRRNADGTWTGTDAYFAGERLQVVRDAAGAVAHLDIASFVLTRAPYDPDADIPGGVDGPWR